MVAAGPKSEIEQKMNENSTNGALATPSFEDLEREWLTNAEAARLLSISPATLRDYRAKGRSPRFHKRGHAVLYRRSDVEAHLGRTNSSGIRGGQSYA